LGRRRCADGGPDQVGDQPQVQPFDRVYSEHSRTAQDRLRRSPAPRLAGQRR
jgi:hypothetical protein